HPHPGGPPPEADGRPARRRGAERGPGEVPPQQAPRTRLAPAVVLVGGDKARRRPPEAATAPPDSGGAGRGCAGTAPSLVPPGSRGPPLRALHVAAFAAALAVFTWKLLEPRAVPEVMRAELSGGVIFAISKCLHAAGYATL